MHRTPVKTNVILEGVRYEIRGELAARAAELERQGYEIISLNIGNPGLFGYRTPETMRLAMIENLGQSEAYCHQKGIFPATRINVRYISSFSSFARAEPVLSLSLSPKILFFTSSSSLMKKCVSS